VIWSWQRSFYDSQGMDAWKPRGLPFWMTSNAFFARAMARVVAGFLRDLVAAGAAALDASAPVHVVELAAGSGQFAFAFLRALHELMPAIPGLRGLRVRYVMTDFAEGNVSAWRAHERLRPFVQAGQLDFARFDLERDGQLSLLESGETLSPSASGNPLVALATYAFDTTRQDCFRIRDGRLWQSLVTTLLAGGNEPSPSDAVPLDRVRLRFENVAMDAAYYDDPLSNRVLEGYRARLGDTAFLFPVAAVQCARRLLDLAGGRLFLLCGDKGVAHEEELMARGDPVMTLHGDAFSFIVNLNALGHYFEEAGGLALHGQRHVTGFHLSGFLSGFPVNALPESLQAFHDHVDGFGPAEFFTLVRSICTTLAAPPLDTVLALLRLCAGDVEVFYVYREVLLAHAREATAPQRRELRRALAEAWEGYYPLHKDLAFDLARISMAMKEPEDARRYCDESLRLFGRRHETLLMLAFSHTLLGHFALARPLAEESLALRPDSEAARDLVARLQHAPGRPA
jgi:SAM-dependent methyltransferase